MALCNYAMRSVDMSMVAAASSCYSCELIGLCSPLRSGPIRGRTPHRANPQRIVYLVMPPRILSCRRHSIGLGAFLLATFALLGIERCPAATVEAIVTAQVGVRTSPNASADLANADLLGNGDVLISTFGNPEALSFNISKTDFYKDRSQNASGVGVNPMPLRAGVVTVNIAALAGATYRQEQDMYKAEVRTILTKGSIVVTATSRVAATANNLLLTELTNSSTTDVAVALDTVANTSFADHGATTGAGLSGNIAWVTRTGPNGLGWGPTYNAFKMRASLATRVFGPTAIASTDSATKSTLTFTLPANSTATLVTSIVSTGGDILTNAPTDPTPTATSAVGTLTTTTIANYNTAHLAWWSAFWNKSQVELDAEPTLMRYYYGALYVLASSNRAGKFAPGLNGWNGTDTPQWSGDYTTNYNIQSPYYGVYSSNHPELAQSYYKAILSIHNNHGMIYATQRGFQGTYFKTHYGPNGIQTDNNNGGGDWGQKTDALESAVNFINDYAYTLDATTLQSGYPFLLKVADFWDAYLVKDASGRYVVNDSNVAEGSTSYSMNVPTALSFLRTFYTAMIEASSDLGVDANRQAKWQDILTNLSAYPTVPYQGRTVFAFSENNAAADSNAYPYNLYPVHPSNQVGISSPLSEIARATIATRSYWNQNNSFPQIYPAAIKAGYPAAEVISAMKSRLGTLAPNNFFKQSGGGIETVGAIEAINAMLLQSTERVLRFFPNWTGTDARFTNLRAVGAFVVSAGMAGGVVQSASFTSEKGEPVNVQNPWPGQDLIVTQSGGSTVATTRAAGIYSFSTTPGATYTLSPAGGIPSARPTSLSIYKNVSATSSVEQSGWSAAAAADGWESSLTGSLGWSSSNSTTIDHTEAITIDLRGNYLVSRVVLTPRTDGVNTGYGFPIDFTIALSSDNVNWTTPIVRTAYALPAGVPQEFIVPPQTTQFVKITGTKLRANPNDGNRYRMQFAEVAVQPLINLALNAPTTASSSLETGGWGVAKAVDGIGTSVTGAFGWSSTSNLSVDHTEWVMVDLGSAQPVSIVSLLPRTDGVNAGYGYPIDFIIESATTAGGPWTTIATGTGAANPGTTPQTFNFTERSARYVRLTGTKLRSNPNDANQYRMQLAEIVVARAN